MTHAKDLMDEVINSLDLPYTNYHALVDGLQTEVLHRGVRYRIEIRPIAALVEPIPHFGSESRFAD